MVKLTVDLIARGTSGYTKKKRDESMHNYLKRLTHLYLEDRCIDEIGDDLSVCRNLTVLYLYDNKLEKIPNLNPNGNLTHLYLQNNHITKLEHLGGLRKLTKLYVGGNSITVLEGLDKLELLQELHMEHQKLPPGEKMLFDPRTLRTLSNSLQVLNVSGNSLESILDLSCLTCLGQCIASDNCLNDMKEMAHCLSSWRSLWRLDLIGNPLCHKTKYRDRIIILAPSLEVLDGKEISETSKQFLKNWQANKEAQKRKRASRQEVNGGHMQDQRGEGEMHDQPLQPHIRSQVPGYIMPALPRKQFQEVLARSASVPETNVIYGMPPSNVHRTMSELAPPNFRSRARHPGSKGKRTIPPIPQPRAFGPFTETRTY